MSSVRLSTVKSMNPLRVAGPLRITQHNFLDLAGGGLEQLAKFDPRGALEVRQMLSAKGDDFVRAGASARLERDECLGPFTPSGVWNGDHSALQHSRMT